MRIFLIGFMGSGKSHWGKIWAEVAEMEFYDLDEKIVAREQMSIDEIFNKKGEDYFRLIETEVLKECATIDNCIVACGGGTPCYHNNIELINEMGVSVYLEATPTKLFKNIMPEIDKRPLLKKVNTAEILFFIEQKLAERKKYYAQAKITWQMEDLTPAIIQTLI